MSAPLFPAFPALPACPVAGPHRPAPLPALSLPALVGREHCAQCRTLLDPHPAFEHPACIQCRQRVGVDCCGSNHCDDCGAVTCDTCLLFADVDAALGRGGFVCPGCGDPKKALRRARRKAAR